MGERRTMESMERLVQNLNFFKHKKVFLTGHTGFKGSWLSKILLDAGANVTGFSLEPPTSPNLFDMLHLKEKMHSVIGDIRNDQQLLQAYNKAKPDIVFHLAAQPLVRDSYLNPVYTYETNVMGTVNLLECVRQYGETRSVIIVTTDKVYQNNEWDWGYRENDRLCGFDPYSNSKSCAELVVHSYIHSFFNKSEVAVSSLRAGNVIGGGDFAHDRILPDCIRAAMTKVTMQLRHPESIRPYQHVLEPLFAYLLLAEKQYHDAQFSGAYNIGPDNQDCITTSELVSIFSRKWGKGFSYEVGLSDGPHEANFLKLDCSKFKQTFKWLPLMNIETAIEKTVEWAKQFAEGQPTIACVENQIEDYLNLIKVRSPH